MAELEPNSYKYKEKKKLEEKAEEHRLTPVVSAEVKVQKKSPFQKIKESFITTDKDTLKDYIWQDLLVPFCKRSVLELISMILYNNPNVKNSPGGTTSKVIYGGFVNGVKNASQTIEPIKKRSLNAFNLDQISFSSRGDAQIVLDGMYQALQTFGEVRVLDLYDLARISTDSLTADSYGWTDLTGSDIVRGFNGYYYLKLPNVRALIK